MDLHTKNQTNPHHGLQEKCKLFVGDDGRFLKNHATIFLKLGDYVPLTKIHLHVKNQIHRMHGFQDIGKMDVGDYV